MAKLRELWGIDIRTLAFLRVFFGLILLADIIVRIPDLAAHYSDWGILPRQALLLLDPTPWYISFHMISGLWQVQAALFLVQAIFALMLLVGYKTRLATIVSWLFIVSLENRMPIILQGGDVLLRVSLFWAMFLPWGRTYSVDAALRPAREENNIVLSIGTAGYLLQAVFVYVFAAMLKTGAMWRTEGTAVYYTLQLDQLTSSGGYFLLKFPLVLKLLTFFTFGLEAIGPFLLYIPVLTQYVRLMVTAAYVGMHSGIIFSMKIGVFPFISIASILGYLPSLFWDLLLPRLKTPERRALKIYYDTDCGFCRKTVHIIRMFFLIPETTVAPAQHDPSVFEDMLKRNSWVVIDSHGNRHFELDGIQVIAQHSPLLWPFAPLLRLSPLQYLGKKIYRWVARQRVAQCTPGISDIPTPLHTTPRPLVTMGSFALGAFFILYIFAWNVGGVYSNWSIPYERQWIGLLLRLDQRWDMFSPFPLTEDGWYVMPGELRDGTSLDIFQNNTPVSWDKPTSVANTYSNHRWRKYFLNFWLSGYSAYRPYYANYICQEWNDSHPYDKQLTHFKIIFMLERSLPDYQISTPEPVDLWDQYCAI